MTHEERRNQILADSNIAFGLLCCCPFCQDSVQLLVADEVLYELEAFWAEMGL